MESGHVQRLAFRPKADATVLARKLPPPPEFPKNVGPVYDRENVGKPISSWPVGAEKAYYTQGETYAPAGIPDKPALLTDRYLRAFLAKNERLRLSMLWYYTRNIFNEVEFLSGLQEKLCLAQESTGWEFAIVGTLDLNFYTRLATIGVPLGILPRGETLCAHTVTQPPGSVFLLPNLMEDWRFADCPYLESGGLQAYAGAPLRLQNESGDIVCLGSFCVASSTRQDPLTKVQQATLVRLADWIVSDIVQLTRARRQHQRRRMVDLIATTQKEINDTNFEECIRQILRAVYPEATISLQSSRAGRIEVEGRGPVSIAEFSDDMWEDIDYIDDFIATSNHMEFPADRVVRVIAAPCESVLGHSFLTVGTKDFRFVFDDIDAWFVQTCAGIISQMWHKHLLEEVMFAKEKFLRGFSHQLRTPVHGILGSVELLAEELNSKSLNETVEQAAAMLRATSVAKLGNGSRIYLDTIKRAGRDLIAIINSMITLNRWADVATTERQYATYTIHDLEKELADEMTNMTSGDTRYNASIIFNHNIPPDYCSFRTDIGLLRDSVLPLIINAIQNTTDGIVVVTISAYADSSELIVDIKDTGRGIPLADRKRIFELYEQVDVYSTGAGLGLTLACRFAALLNGSVELVSSELSHGSHFRATFQDIEVLRSEPSLLPEPLVPQLPRLPKQFHVIPNTSKGLSLANEFAALLDCHGLVSSDQAIGALVIVDFVPDPEKYCASISQIPQDHAIICLVPNLQEEAPLLPELRNIIYIRGPFLTPTMSMALQAANNFLSEIAAGQVEVAEPSKEQDLSPKFDQSKGYEELVQPDNLVIAVGATRDAMNGLGIHGSKLTEEPSTHHELSSIECSPLNQKPTVDKDTSLKHTELLIGDSSIPETGHTIPISKEPLPILNSNVPKFVTHDVIHSPPAELRDKQSNFTFPDIAGISKPTALIVDDNVVNLRVMQMYCSKRDLPYICAKDGLEAVSSFRSHQECAVSERTKPPIQLILMDLQMPNCDGIEATKQIRQLEEKNGWGSSVLFVVTGQDSVADRKAVSEAGGQEYYVKPVSIKSLDAGLKNYFPCFNSSGS